MQGNKKLYEIFDCIKRIYTTFEGYGPHLTACKTTLEAQHIPLFIYVNSCPLIFIFYIKICLE